MLKFAESREEMWPQETVRYGIEMERSCRHVRKIWMSAWEVEPSSRLPSGGDTHIIGFYGDGFVGERGLGQDLIYEVVRELEEQFLGIEVQVLDHKLLSGLTPSFRD